MTVPQKIDRHTFLANLRESGLLPAQQLETAIDGLPETERARVVARTFVDRGLITKFQAEMLLAGRTGGFILGQYRILDQLGRGGMGRVFKAEHQTMNRVVALKVLAGHLVKTEKAQLMFQREVRAAARLVHPNIVTAYDANQIGDRYYLVMEYVDGPNLEELVRDLGPLPIGQACEFIRQAALGLQYAHELGMVHRDIKPANLLVQHGKGQGAGCNVKILDFGLARLHADGDPGEASEDSIMTAHNTVMGTPDYMAPEQARDLHKVDIRSDLYSLGCTFFYLLTGHVPYPGGSTMEKLVRHTTEETPQVEDARANIPAPVAAIVRRLMAKDPNARFQTPTELAAALAPFAVQGPTGWAGHESRFYLSDSPAVTPLQFGGDDAAVRPNDPDGSSALAGTLSNDLLLTPMSVTELPSMLIRRAVQQDQRRRLKIAVAVAVSLVSSAVVLVSWLMLR